MSPCPWHHASVSALNHYTLTAVSTCALRTCFVCVLLCFFWLCCVAASSSVYRSLVVFVSQEQHCYLRWVCSSVVGSSLCWFLGVAGGVLSLIRVAMFLPLYAVLHPLRDRQAEPHQRHIPCHDSLDYKNCYFFTESCLQIGFQALFCSVCNIDIGWRECNR